MNYYGDYDYMFMEPTMNITGSDTIYLTNTRESESACRTNTADSAENRTISVSRVKMFRSAIYDSVTGIARKLRDLFLDVICGLINLESGSGSVVVMSIMVAVVTATIIYHILQCF